MSLRDEIIAGYPLDAVFRKLGCKGAEKPANGKLMVSCPFHDDKTPSLSVDVHKGLWKCFSCGEGGTVIDLYMRKHGLSVKDAMFEMAEKRGIKLDTRRHVTATYKYCDQYGKERMRVDRIEEGRKKEFRQYRMRGDERLNGIDGVSRVLYRYESWHAKQTICLTEGEKCVHALESVGMDATCNPGGSKSWLDAYSGFLKEKNVEIWPDNDEPGQEWLDTVIESLAGKVAKLRVIHVPERYNDVADMIDAKGEEAFWDWFMPASEQADWIDRGVKIDLLSADEAIRAYEKRVMESDKCGINLGRWLPSLSHHTRPLLPGDLVLLLADTGVGKTACLANMAYSQQDIPTIFFELELAPEAMAERFIARDTRTEAMEVESNVKAGKIYSGAGWSHVYLCPRSKMSADDMRDIIIQSELKIGRKPALVLVDYVGLVDGRGGQYERMTQIAESMKRLARETETVVCIASQVARREGRTEVGLHDAKDSGQLENSAQLVLGVWRPEENQMAVKILKQTRRAGQHTVLCNYDGNRQLINEREVHHAAHTAD